MTRCQTYFRKQHHKVICRVFLIVISLIFSTTSYAYSFTSWHPIIAIGAGTSTSTSVGKSQNFPIQNPSTDQFYNYSANQPTQTSSLFDGFLGAEFNLRPNWALQVGVDYNQASPYSAKGTLLQGADIESADSYTYHYGVLTKQLLIEGKLLYTVKERYHPYVLGGLGAAFNKAYNYYTNVPPFLTFTRMYQDNTVTAFSYAIGFGIDVDLTSHFRVGAGYRFADLGQVKLGNAMIDTTNVNGTLSQTHLYTNEILAQFTIVV